MITTYRNNRGITSTLKGLSVRRGMAWGAIIIGALLAFEMFNYSTTQFALNDVLGDLKFAGIRWATILALAFCGIDFAAPGCSDERDPHLVGCGGRHLQPYQPEQRGPKQYHSDQGGTGLCGHHGLVNPCSDHRDFLDQGGEIVQPG
jgi:hypothetical protein